MNFEIMQISMLNISFRNSILMWFGNFSGSSMGGKLGIIHGSKWSVGQFKFMNAAINIEYSCERQRAKRSNKFFNKHTREVDGHCFNGGAEILFFFFQVAMENVNGCDSVAKKRMSSDILKLYASVDVKDKCNRTIMGTSTWKKGRHGSFVSSDFTWECSTRHHHDHRSR